MTRWNCWKKKKEKIFNIRYKSSKDRDYIKESRALPILLLNEEQGTREQLPGTPESLLTRHTVTDAHANSFQMYAEDGNACGEAWRRRILAEGSVKKYFSPTMERRRGTHIYIYTQTHERASAAWLSTQPPEFLIEFGGSVRRSRDRELRHCIQRSRDSSCTARAR